MALTGFERVSAEEKQSANQLNTLSQGSSPFIQGLTFTITGFDYEKAKIDGVVPPNAKPQPVFICKIDGSEDPVSLFVKPLQRGVACADGTVLEHKGTFNLWVRDQIASLRGKNDGEMLTAMVNGLSGRKIVVNRVPYVAKSKDDRTYAASLVDLDFVVD